MRFFILLLTFCFSFPSYAESVLRVGLINYDRPPYFWLPRLDNSASGFYIDLLEAVGAKADLEFEYLFYPQVRLRRYMLQGKLDLEPGIDRIWRREPGEEEASVYSKPFLASGEVLVLSKQVLDFYAEQQGFVNCAVLGFNTAENLNETQGQNNQQLLTEVQILKSLDSQRCNRALMPQHVLEYYLSESDYDVIVSNVVKTYILRLRLHRSQQHLLPTINKALEVLISEGEIERLLRKYHMK